MHMTVTLVRPGDQRLFIASRDTPLGCHLLTNPSLLTRKMELSWACGSGPWPWGAVRAVGMGQAARVSVAWPGPGSGWRQRQGMPAFPGAGGRTGGGSGVVGDRGVGIALGTGDVNRSRGGADRQRAGGVVGVGGAVVPRQPQLGAGRRVVGHRGVVQVRGRSLAL